MVKLNHVSKESTIARKVIKSWLVTRKDFWSLLQVPEGALAPNLKSDATTNLTNPESLKSIDDGRLRTFE